jgi:hypothetical protein
VGAARYHPNCEKMHRQRRQRKNDRSHRDGILQAVQKERIRMRIMVLARVRMDGNASIS